MCEVLRINDYANFDCFKPHGRCGCDGCFCYSSKQFWSKKSLGKKSYVPKRFGPKTMLFKESMFQKFRSDKIIVDMDNDNWNLF